jgi:benzoyl-CoA reductase/2-hydroxyglutaryl-CoA dehydratase subunit BcrC/BadD/HgdB
MRILLHKHHTENLRLNDTYSIQVHDLISFLSDSVRFKFSNDQKSSKLFHYLLHNQFENMSKSLEEYTNNKYTLEKIRKLTGIFSGTQ